MLGLKNETMQLKNLFYKKNNDCYRMVKLNKI